MEVRRTKNLATYITFPIMKNDGTLITGATGLDSEIDTYADGSAPDGFTDCTNEATEIGSTGIYYLSLTQAEMNADYIVIQIKSSSSGAVTQVILINTTLQRADVIGISGDTGAADTLETYCDGGDRMPVDVEEIGNNIITAASIADAAIDKATLAADLKTGDYINAQVKGQDNIDFGALQKASLNAATPASVGSVTGNVSGSIGSLAAQAKADVNAEVDSALNTAIPGSPTADSINERVKAIDDKLPTGNIGDATADNQTTMDGKLDVIQAKTDNLPASPAATGDAMTLADDSITSAKFDESTAFPVKSADSGATQIARVGADGDTLETLSDQIDTVDGVADAIKLKTDNLPASPAATGDIPSATSIADAVLKRDVDQVEATAPIDSLASVVLKNTSKVTDDAGTLKTYRTDRATLHMSQVLDTDASAEPITEIGGAT